MTTSLISKTEFQKLLCSAINLNSFNRRNKLGIAVNHKPSSWALVGLLKECLPKDSLHAFSVDLKLNSNQSSQILNAANKLNKFGIPVQVLEFDLRKVSDNVNDKTIRHTLNSMLVRECIKNNISILALGSTLEDYLTDLLCEIFSRKAGYVHGLDILSRLGVEGDMVMAIRPLLKYNTVFFLFYC
jgi:tRNA(Ile)-lysidine synthase TilS/MesJ